MTRIGSPESVPPHDVTDGKTPNRVDRQFLLFLITGGLAALVNFFSRIGFSRWMDYTPAIILAYACGMITAFVLNRLFVFRHSINRLHHQMFWFAVVNLFAVAQTILVSLVLAELLFPRMGMTWHAESVAHGIGVLVPVVTSFLGHKHLTFRTR
ncbi:GtrA family protein [Rhodanobacter sp. C01]|uniref:GtrA family protein n=1 Tax=Rhodanobacter sp. C01 TaxID=1945856 RepID=UPI000984250C|nr:GtrA family protein [Rhodanobacter sp. C01]